MKYIKQILVGGIVVVIFVAYAFYSRMSSGSDSSISSDSTSSNSAPTTSSAASASSAPTTSFAASASSAPATTALYKDGTYTGAVEDAYFGNLQVAAVVSGGKLIDVQFLQYPNTSGHSEQVNENSNPILKSEAIQAQSANVDIVSGATQSSQAFQQSLASALAEAKA